MNRKVWKSIEDTATDLVRDMRRDVAADAFEASELERQLREEDRFGDFEADRPWWET